MSGSVGLVCSGQLSVSARCILSRDLNPKLTLMNPVKVTNGLFQAWPSLNPSFGLNMHIYLCAPLNGPDPLWRGGCVIVVGADGVSQGSPQNCRIPGFRTHVSTGPVTGRRHERGHSVDCGSWHSGVRGVSRVVVLVALEVISCGSVTRFTHQFIPP